MSRHFELIQQLEQERLISSESPTTTASPAIDVTYSGESQTRWASDEALRLVQQVFLLQTREPSRVVVFAGIDHGNGCSQMCASVAETLAKNAHKPVCLVEANFRSPALPGLFGTTNHRGLTESLLNEGPVRSFATPVNSDNLWLLSSGSLASDSPNLLTSGHLAERLKELREEFDYVVIDAPPLTRYSDAIVLGQLADGLVLILEAEQTRRDAALFAAASLRSANIPILAAVLNKRTFPIPEQIYRRL